MLRLRTLFSAPTRQRASRTEPMKSPNEEAVARGYKDVLEWLLDDGDD